MANRAQKAFFTAVALAIFTLYPTAKTGSPDRGVVVEKAEEPGAGYSAGVRPGDLLLGWKIGERGGAFKSAMDFDDVAVEQGSRGRVTLYGRRGAEALELRLPAEPWKLEVRPVLGSGEMALYESGLHAAQKGDTEAAAADWGKLASNLVRRGDVPGECWARLRLARALAKGGDFAGARGECEAVASKARRTHPECAARCLEQLYLLSREAGDIEAATSATLEAAGIRRKLDPDGLLLASDLNRAGTLAVDTERKNDARAMFAEARAIVDRRAPDSAEAAQVYGRSGVFAWGEGDMATAEEQMRRAVQIWEKLKSGQRQLAKDLYNLASVLAFKGDFDGAEAATRRSLSIQEEMGLKGVEVANSWRGLGTIAQMRGDLDMAESHYRNALAIMLEYEPDDLRTAYTYDNLGVLAWSRGNLDLTEELMQKSLEICKAKDPEGQDVAEVYGNMGVLAWYRGDAERARALYERSLEMKKKAGPKNSSTADTLINMGILEKAAGNMERARECYLGALAIFKETYPDGPGVANAITNIGNLLRETGDLAGAKAKFEEALAMVQKRASGSLEEATILFNMGTLLDSMGQPAEALSMLERSLEISSKLAPGSSDLAETNFGLGAHWSKAGDRQRALASYFAAVEALESQRGKLGGGSRAGETFSGKYAEYYRTLAIEQVRAGRGSEAFSTMEHFRARALLEMLAERDIDFSMDAPPELLREQRRAEQELDSLQEQLASLNPATEAAQVDSTLKQLGEAHAAREAVLQKIRAASPELAGLKYPSPIGLQGLRAAVPEGVLFLSYCVGKEETCLVASLGGRVESRVIRLDRSLLRRQVGALRAMISDGEASERSLSELAKRIYSEVLGPVRHMIGESKGLIICPDGPLHSLPFAVLPGVSARYMVEERPVSYAISATVLVGLKAAAGGRGEHATVEAFGAPAYVPGAVGGGEKPATGALSMARRAEPLPGTRAEVHAICGIYRGSCTAHLGAGASEEEAKHLDKTPCYIHFACHAFLDDRFPLDSGLALSAAGEGENGFLQGWEIFESLRIGADMVALSACETGLGTEMGGEGLIGLTRAFQYAGARSVLSSLWPVSDESTAELMKGVYSELKQGKPKAEALRLAQLALINSKRLGAKSSNPQPSSSNPQLSTLNPQPSSTNPQPISTNPQPSTLNPKPSTRFLPPLLLGRICAERGLEVTARPELFPLPG